MLLLENPTKNPTARCCLSKRLVPWRNFRKSLENPHKTQPYQKEPALPGPRGWFQLKGILHLLLVGTIPANTSALPSFWFFRFALKGPFEWENQRYHQSRDFINIGPKKNQQRLTSTGAFQSCAGSAHPAGLCCRDTNLDANLRAQDLLQDVG